MVAVARYAAIDVSGFVNIADDAHAYWLGFLAADACVWDRPRKDGNRPSWVRLELAASDANQVEAFRAFLGCEQPMRLSTYGGYNRAHVVITSRPLVAALAAWGVVAGKTAHLAFPKQLRADLVPSYIRGYFDGDGSAMVRNRRTWKEVVCRFTCGSEPFLSDMAVALAWEGVATRPVYHNSPTTHVLPVSSEIRNMRRFVECLYAGAAVWLPRKRTLLEGAI